ncbi:MAG TPA: hypothetical protein VJL78_02330 [Candidatus Nitrosocosmicus sp.]|nr:hypothetical protein [Candidatus Nitrosocosmicus sp.]
MYWSPFKRYNLLSSSLRKEASIAEVKFQDDDLSIGTSTGNINGMTTRNDKNKKYF